MKISTNCSIPSAFFGYGAGHGKYNWENKKKKGRNSPPLTNTYEYVFGDAHHRSRR